MLKSWSCDPAHAPLRGSLSFTGKHLLQSTYLQMLACDGQRGGQGENIMPLKQAMQLNVEA